MGAEQSLSSVRGSGPERQDAVDAFRFLAMLGVIIIHTTPFIDASARSEGQFSVSGVLLNQLSRCAIPFFFTISGYFWGKRVRRESVGPVTVRAVKRLLLVYTFWTVFWFLPLDLSAFINHGLTGPLKVAYWNILGLIHNPLELLFAGSVQTLWFVMALICTLAIAATFVRFGLVMLLVLLGAALYVLGALNQGYADTPVGTQIPFNTLYGPFCGTLPFAIGYLLSRFTPQRSWLPWGIAVLVLGYTFHFSEIIHMWKVWQAYPLKHYVFSTWLIGAGMAIVALSGLEFPGRQAMARYGRLAFGVYLVQPFFINAGELLAHFIRSPLWEIGHVAFVLVFSILTVRWMMRVPMLSRFVS